MDRFFLIIVSPGKRASIEEYLRVADSMAPIKFVWDNLCHDNSK